MKLMRRLGLIAVGPLVLSAVIPTIAVAEQKQRSAAQQQFICNVGYELEECKVQLAMLQTVVEKYPTKALGEWTWVMVKSKDWEEIMVKFKLNPYSPAFTCLEKKVTFIEEAIVVSVPNRTYELVLKWHMGSKSLLDFAVAHEMGHAMCATAQEDKANRVAGLLQRSAPLSCQVDF